MNLPNSVKRWVNLYEPKKIWHYGYLQRRYANYWIANQLNIQVQSGKHVLDYGCGTSPQKAEIESRCGIYTGIDVKETRFGSIFDGKEAPFQDESFDIVLMNEVIYAIPDGRRAIKECHRLLKPGGVLVISANFLYPLNGNQGQFDSGFGGLGATIFDLQKLALRNT